MRLSHPRTHNHFGGVGWGVRSAAGPVGTPQLDLSGAPCSLVTAFHAKAYLLLPLSLPFRLSCHCLCHCLSLSFHSFVNDFPCGLAQRLRTAMALPWAPIRSGSVSLPRLTASIPVENHYCSCKRVVQLTAFTALKDLLSVSADHVLTTVQGKHVFVKPPCKQP